MVIEELETPVSYHGGLVPPLTDVQVRALFSDHFRPVWGSVHEAAAGSGAVGVGGGVGWGGGAGLKSGGEQVNGGELERGAALAAAATAAIAVRGGAGGVSCACGVRP